MAERGPQAIAYCAKCLDLGYDPEERIGLRFLCPNQTSGGPDHLASIVKGDPGKRWLRIERRLWQWEARGGLWLGLFKKRAGWIVFLRLVIVAVLAWSYSSWACPTLRALDAFIVVVLILDMLVVNTSVAFVSRSPASPLRSVLLTVVCFVTLVVGYSTIYLLVFNSFCPPLNWFRALYFSFVTATTVGYGDIQPLQGAHLAQLLIVLELVLALYFLAVLVAIVVNWANLGAAQRLKTLDELSPLVRLQPTGNVGTPTKTVPPGPEPS